MKKTLLALLAMMMAVAGVSRMAIADEDQGDYARRLAVERHQDWPSPFGSLFGPYGSIDPDRFLAGSGRAPEIKAALAAQVRQQIGDRWVEVSRRIVEIESHYNPSAVGPKTRHGQALGLGQLLLTSAWALGYHGDAKGLLDPQTNIVFTVAHMKRCVEAGVVSDDDMAGCHVAGWGNFRSQSPYARSYRKMVAHADINAPDRTIRHRVRYARRHYHRYAHARRKTRYAMR